MHSFFENKKKENLFVLLLTLIQFTHILDFVIMMPLGPQLIRIMHITPRQFSLMVSAYTFSAAIFGLISAFFIDRFDRKFSLQFLFVGFIFGTLLCGFAPDYTWLVAGRIIAGSFGGILGGLIFSMIGDTIPFERRGLATGKVMSAFSLASVLGVPTGLALANYFNWHAPFRFLGVFSIIVFLLTFKFIPPLNAHLKHKSKVNEFQNVIEIFKDKNHLWAFLQMCILMFGSFTIIPFISPVMIFNVGLKETDLPYIYLVGGLCTFFSARFIGHLSDKFGKRKMYTIVAILSLFPMALLTNIVPMRLTFAIIITTIFMVLVSGRAIPAMAIITSSTSMQNRGRFMSLNSSLQQMAAGLATFIAGLMISTDTNKHIHNYNNVGLLAITAVFISIFVIRKIKIVTEKGHS